MRLRRTKLTEERIKEQEIREVLDKVLNVYQRHEWHTSETQAYLDALVPVVAQLLSQQDKLNRCRAVMIRAMDALESDTELDARREAFEMIQEQFEGVSAADHERAEALIPQLKAALADAAKR